MTLANWITLARLPLVLGALLALVPGRPCGYLTAAVLVELAGNSDYLDGWLARRRGEVTARGTSLDFLVDKLCVLSLLFALAWQSITPLWVPLVVLGRELVVAGVRLARFGRNPPPPDLLGKAKTGLTWTAVFVLLLRRALPSAGGAGGWLLDLGPWLMLSAVILTVVSGANYLMKYTRPKPVKERRP